ncbi:hypothetical protein CBR_g23955 [Chara braunii]|uniref:Uncharacterized protein n=1 Tax=Chara braunii TaxID=69332 RepID=A0A388L5C1_CHABU|nr:hypothetical protein CBR_g23955 [Chara braunii]|eukprot:GBG77510.1 hypothetical protein CBR_g23955 [Chara braunii]
MGGAVTHFVSTLPFGLWQLQGLHFLMAAWPTPVAAATVCACGSCAWWNRSRWLHRGADDSEGWPPASPDRVREILKYTRLAEGACERNIDDLLKRANCKPVPGVPHPIVTKEDIVCFEPQNVGNSPVLGSPNPLMQATRLSVLQSALIQDDFWPRIATSIMQKIFLGMICGVQAVMFVRFCRDLFIPEEERLSNPRRLYPPGQLYHIVYQKAGFSGLTATNHRVLTANPQGGRFEKIILSLRATADHRLRSYDAALEKVIANLDGVRLDIDGESNGEVESVDRASSTSVAAGVLEQ